MPTRPSFAARSAAGLIAAVAWLGLIVQFDASFARIGSVAGTVWTMLFYFTVIANLLVATLFTAVAFGKYAAFSPFATGGAAVMMILVGVTYGFLLRGLIELSGGARLADFLLHSATPVLVPAFWLLFAAKGALRWRDPWWWAVIPALYLPYALVRGLAGGAYPYPFINVVRIGWTQTFVNALGMGLAFLGAGFALVGLDRLLAGRSSSALR